MAHQNPRLELTVGTVYTWKTHPTEFGPQGQGVVRLDDGSHGVVLIDGTAPGDEVQARVSYVSRNKPLAGATVHKLLCRGNDFVQPRCVRAAPVRGKCGGCPVQHLSADAQRRFKIGAILSALAEKNLGGEELQILFDHAPSSWGYRNRGHYVLGRAASGRIILGSYMRGTHDVVSMRGCLINREGIRKAAFMLEEWCNTQNVPIFPDPEGLRYVTIRADVHERALVELVSLVHEPNWLGACIEAISKEESIVGLSISCNDSKGNTLHTQPAHHLWGEESVTERVAQYSMEAHARGFLQLNSAVASHMYTLAAELLQGNDSSVVWDLYCGMGLLGLEVLKRQGEGASLYGAESHEQSVRHAQAVAAKQGVGATFEIVDLRKEWRCSWPNPTKIIVNPPRRGLDAPVLELLTNSSCTATDLVYMSCDPATFAKDARVLCDTGWILEPKVYAFDMLPHTVHVELLAKFTRVLV